MEAAIRNPPLSRQQLSFLGIQRACPDAASPLHSGHKSLSAASTPEFHPPGQVPVLEAAGAGCRMYRYNIHLLRVHVIKRNGHAPVIEPDTSPLHKDMLLGRLSCVS